jgi:XTP/dITP diphosphohydrolase
VVHEEPAIEFVLASRNAHKVRELQGLLRSHRLAALPDGIELPPETGASFEENALIKARAAARATAGPALADDSGISVMALGGDPGVRSARYAGQGASDEQNLDKLVQAMADQKDRRAAYVCVLALAWPDGRAQTFEGRCSGRLAAERRGVGGFGYDPIFLPDEQPGSDGRTMAELSAREKDAISHRGAAARRLAAWLSVHA